MISKATGLNDSSAPKERSKTHASSKSIGALLLLTRQNVFDRAGMTSNKGDDNRIPAEPVVLFSAPRIWDSSILTRDCERGARLQ